MRAVSAVVVSVTGPFWLSGCGGGGTTTHAPAPAPKVPTTTGTTTYHNMCWGFSDPLPADCTNATLCNCYHPDWGDYCSEAKNKTHCETSSAGAVWESPCFYAGITSCSQSGTTTGSPDTTTTTASKCTCPDNCYHVDWTTGPKCEEEVDQATCEADPSPGEWIPCEATTPAPAPATTTSAGATTTPAPAPAPTTTPAPAPAPTTTTKVATTTTTAAAEQIV